MHRAGCFLFFFSHLMHALAAPSFGTYSRPLLRPEVWRVEVKNVYFWLLIFGVLASTFLSALTLSRHRCALRNNRPYGWGVALVVSALQLAPFVEMLDKLGDGVCWGREEDLSSPLASVGRPQNHRSGR